MSVQAGRRGAAGFLLVKQLDVVLPGWPSAAWWQKPAHLLLQAQSCDPACFSSQPVHKLSFLTVLCDFSRAAENRPIRNILS